MNTQESVEASKLLRGVYISIVRPPDLLSPIESRDVCREDHSIDESNIGNLHVERRSIVRKDLPHDRESGRTIDRTTSACEPERAIDTRPLPENGATLSESQ